MGVISDPLADELSRTEPLVEGGKATPMTSDPLTPSSAIFRWSLQVRIRRLLRTSLPALQRTALADQPRLYRQLLTDVVAHPLPARRNRSNPRVVK